MTAAERRILTTTLIGKAMTSVMATDQDEMRVKCFERTGCLLTLLANEDHDSRIKPQGMKE